MYKDMYYIWSCIFHIYTSKCVCVRLGRKARRECNVFIWQPKSMLRFYAWLLAWPLTHTHTPRVTAWSGTRSDCVDGNALIRLWQSIMQLTWLGAAAAKNG